MGENEEDKRPLTMDTCESAKSTKRRTFRDTTWKGYDWLAALGWLVVLLLLAGLVWVWVGR